MDTTIFKYIRGSRCHGIATPQSDTDTGGIYVADLNTMLGLEHYYKPLKESSDHNDVMFELGKFSHLLLKSNPSVIEALFVNKEFITEMHPAFNIFIENRDMFLTRACFPSFGGYAKKQIEKCRGLNKMITQPIVERKDPDDFCYVVCGNDTISLYEWLFMKSKNIQDISLAKMNHARDLYAIFDYPGGVCRDGANDIHVTNIPKGLKSIGTLCFNKDAYQVHCRKYKEFKEWEKHRNPVRYESNLHKNYDSKNVCECFRLVACCTEIARGEGFIVDRSGIDREFLLDIRAHKFEYDDIMEILKEKVDVMNKAIEESTIPESVDIDTINTMTIDCRKDIYSSLNLL